ncbi:MAG: glycoside hydrolase family protein [Candidatus Obscuribacter sp.]|nr:glycoside hydrolase family protein [Candidatus Obscuribacter sp.]
MVDQFTRDLIQRHEGRRAHVYMDTANHPTVGVGFNLDRADARTKLTAVGADYDAVRAGNADLTNTQIDRLFTDDLSAADTNSRQVVSTFDALPARKKSVVTDMMFNLGRAKFSQFVNLINALEQHNYASAADEMENSAWYTQVGGRGTEDVAIMREPV